MSEHRGQFSSDSVDPTDHDERIRLAGKRLQEFAEVSRVLGEDVARNLYPHWQKEKKR